MFIFLEACHGAETRVMRESLFDMDQIAVFVLFNMSKVMPSGK